MQNHLELIDDYLDGTISPALIAPFESLLSSDKELSLALHQNKMMRAHLRRARLQRLITDATADMPLPSVSPTPSYRWLAVGGGIMLFSIALGYFIWKNDDVPPATTPLQPITPTVPAEKQVIDDSRASAPATIKENKPTEIATKEEQSISKVSNTPQKADSIDYYIADASPIGYDDWSKNESQWRGSDDAENQRLYFEAYKNLLNNNVTIAENSFRQLANNKRFKNYRRAQWYLALCELSKNPTANNATLNMIANTDGHFFQAKAKRLKAYLVK
jgi:hypothetical protein